MNDSLSEGVIHMKYAVLIGLILLAGCSDVPSTKNALDNIGFTDVESTGYRVFGCGDDYTFHTGFIARNQKGKTVTGVVCSGWLKGSSVKFD